MIKRLAAGVALGAFFLWLALRNVHLSEMAETMRRVSLPVFALFCLMHVSSIGLRSLRWRILLRPLAPGVGPPAPAASGDRLHGQLPAPRARRRICACLASQPPREVSTSAVFATIVVERLFDGLAIICFLAPAPFLLGAGDPALLARIRWAALLLPVVYVAILTTLVLLSHHRERLAGFPLPSPGRAAPAPARPLVQLLERFCDGLAVLRSWRAMAGIVFFSLLIWGWGGWRTR